MIYYIGIVGKRGSGKDTLAKMLKVRFQILRIKSQIINLGDLIRDELSIKFGIPISLLEQSKRIDPEIRLIQQLWGEAKKRIYGDGYWINQVEGLAKAETKVVIIPSVRFLVESNWIHKDNRGMLVSLQGRTDEAQGILADCVKHHVSETEQERIRGIDYTIMNDASLTWLENEAKNVCDIVKERVI